MVFDDDQSIHQIWKERFEKVSASSMNIEMHHVSTVPAFKDFFRTHFADLDQAIFLMDYEIVGSIESGLDLIEQCGIAKQSILVTSRYEEDAIINRCVRLGVKLIPKLMSAYVPII